MATLINRLLSLAIVLGVAQLVCGYSFKNCNEDNKKAPGKVFLCIRRNIKNFSAIIEDLPSTSINLTISINPVSYVPNNSFVHLPRLQNLRLDHNSLYAIGQLAFHNLQELVSLNLSVNHISFLSPEVFQGLGNLTFLSLAENRLKQLPVTLFSTALNIKTLIMRKNSLKNFSAIAESVSHLTNLSILDLCFNNFTSLNHTNMTLPESLRTLYICRNNLLTLGCEKEFLKSIELLDLSYNTLLPTKAFQGLDFRSLHYLRVRSTGLKIMEFLEMSNINAAYVDFSGTGLKNDTQLRAMCKTMQKKKMKYIQNLRLGSNGIHNLTRHSLDHCPKITKALDLSHNELKSIKCLNFLNNQTQINNFSAEHNHITILPSCSSTVNLINLTELSYRYNRIITVGHNAFSNMPNLKTLKLNINTIAFLDQEALKGLKRLEILRLDNNLLTDLFPKSFEDLSNLKTLNLRNNRIAVIFNGTFLSLGNLTTLDLGGNKITQFQASGLDGLKSLSKFYLDGNKLKHIDSSHYRVFQDTLTVLDLQSNELQFSSKSSPFINFTKLSNLKLDNQQPHGLSNLPGTLFRGLHSLKFLYLTNNHISHLYPETFDDLTSLEFLTMDSCCVGVTQLQPGIFKNLRNLTKLTVENMGLQNFSQDIFGNLTKLSTLQLNQNLLQDIPVDALKSLPELTYLDVRGNPLSCTCINSELQNFTIKNTSVQVVYLYHLPCQNDPKHNFFNFDSKVCYLDIGEYLFLGTAVVIFLFTVSPLLYVKLYWKMKYSYYVFCAWFSDQWTKLREEEENCKYDAFISYNSSDEQWIMDQLLPNLEGNGSSFKLCLHHRDFELGRNIVDNIVSAVYSSRKTICVVSRSFLQSEWCSLEIQLASYRLFDEHRDVLLLVFLEPISDRQLSSYHRMRKVMLKKTYLQWPSSDCTNPMQAQELFWNQLRRAMSSGSRLEREKSETPERKETKQFDDHAQNENHSLQPPTHKETAVLLL